MLLDPLVVDQFTIASHLAEKKLPDRSPPVNRWSIRQESSHTRSNQDHRSTSLKCFAQSWAEFVTSVVVETLYLDQNVKE